MAEGGKRIRAIGRVEITASRNSVLRTVRWSAVAFGQRIMRVIIISVEKPPSFLQSILIRLRYLMSLVMDLISLIFTWSLLKITARGV
jgi:hypothetical protein